MGLLNIAKSTIKIGEQLYPLRCDNYVLYQIQETCGSLGLFWQELSGIRVKENGAGKPVYETGEPSMAAINFALPLMVREGLKCSGGELELSDEELLAQVDLDYRRQAKLLLDEYERCFDTKKK